MRTIDEIADHHWSDESTQVAYRIDQSDGRGGSRLAQKARGHRPEDRLKTIE